MLLGRVAIAFDQMLEHVEMGIDVPVEVHGHEARQLQEPGIDLPAHARIGERNGLEAMAPKPFGATALGQGVDFGGAASRVDRPAHQGHRSRMEGIAGRLHVGNGCDERHGRLAHPQRMQRRTAAQQGHDLDQGVDVAVEIEFAHGERHHPGIGPVRDVDIEARQKSFDGAAQEGRVVPGHRCHDEQLGGGGAAHRIMPDEAQQPA